ncbi:Phage SPO1 DNA polymerase-related protein [Nitrospina gracilis 3/211]|uniref:Type-4 uracil-DNA glycosylase n=2 Tax=Nitrospinaceae TaxID=407032 RepID=M1Z0V0_NITG3|nr:Phage SPO1 DNA polymerase-related protein [Nitrospina gracilis 3/211]
MGVKAERAVLLRQLKDYLVFLKDQGMDHVPLLEALETTFRASTVAAVKASAPPASVLASSVPVLQTPTADNTMIQPDAMSRLTEVRNELGECTRCKLAETRTNIVFGSGNPNAKLLFIGEGPGADEDAQGLPFVGRAGKKLTEIIEKGMKLDREKDTYICNIVKCRPPGNRDPEIEEISACKPFLVEQVRAIRPKVIVALGKPAASTLLGRSVAITKERGTWHEFDGIKLMLTFHPAYLLRFYTLENRRAVMEDMQKVLEVLNS